MKSSSARDGQPEAAAAAIQATFLDRHYAAHRDEFDAAYRRVMQRGRFVLGAEVAAFEREFAAYCGTRHCVTTASGLDALTLLLRAHGVGPGDEVLVPANTFIATFLAVSHVGAKPVPVEPDPATHAIDPTRIDSAITSRTRAIVAVHLFGHVADMRAIGETAARHGLAVIEDAAQAHGATFQGRRAGSLAAGGAFSFYPAKNLGAFGDAGAVTLDDGAMASRVARLRNYGATRKNHFEERGVNSRMDELQAAFLRVSLSKLDALNAARQRLAARYAEELSRCADVVALPRVAPYAQPVWHQYVVQCRERDALQQFLASRGIETQVHYPVPPHLQPAYAADRERAGLPVAERLARECLSLPLHPYLTEPEQLAVVEAVKAFCGRQDTPHSAFAAKQSRIREYEREYLSQLGFEATLVEARQAIAVEMLRRWSPATVVEAGCGAHLLYDRAVAAGVEVRQWIIVEPAPGFCERARQAARRDSRLRVVEGFVEDSVNEVMRQLGGKADAVILSGLLHEVESPEAVLHAARDLVAGAGHVHVNVPNALSLHRRLAQAMVLVDTPYELGARNVALGQRRMFDADSLRRLVSDAGLVPEEEGGGLLKPFTNDQMLAVQAVLPAGVIEGLASLGRELPALASEIYLNARAAR